ncbi:hypothetical protein E2C01_046106 [Portunus trituberculatus]|uniref:Uncharacterized protein n=1 Tax=Portunus trituberculatus TaxID=210409 RepID=A0A5B7G4P7_PORTR|nr:hypothetical protein [Portunus trituberculatus]
MPCSAKSAPTSSSHSLMRIPMKNLSIACTVEKDGVLRFLLLKPFSSSSSFLSSFSKYSPLKRPEYPLVICWRESACTKSPIDTIAQMPQRPVGANKGKDAISIHNVKRNKTKQNQRSDLRITEAKSRVKRREEATDRVQRQRQQDHQCEAYQRSAFPTQR